MNNQIPDNLLPPPARKARTAAVRTADIGTADIGTADILSAQAGDTPAAQITRTADILSAQTGGTPAVQSPTKAQRRTTVREPNLFDAAETAE